MDETRNKNILCIVEDPKIVYFMEKNKIFPGKYFVLNNLISPIEGIGPEDIGLNSLKNMLESNNITEMIIAIKSSIEGETTALYIKELFKNKNIKRNIMDELVLETYNQYFKDNKISHSYLFVVDSYELAKEFLIMLSLKINDEIINEQNIKNVKNANDFDITLIDTDKNNITKENIINIEKKYSTKSLMNKKRIYIINEAYKLNRSSSNTLLKFLEEPEENIISFLVVKNKNMLLDTIVSRCIIININLLEKNTETNTSFIDYFKKNKNNFYFNIEKEYPSRENLFSNIEETFKTYDNKTNLNMEEIKFIEILFDIYLLLKTNVNYKTIIDKLNYLIYIKTLNYEFL